jgi:hypothetical protein
MMTKSRELDEIRDEVLRLIPRGQMGLRQRVKQVFDEYIDRAVREEEIARAKPPDVTR